MQIEFRENVFHLQAGGMSYAFGVAPDKRLLNLCWGRALGSVQSLLPLARETLVPFAASAGVDKSASVHYEFATREPGDYGESVLAIRHADGARSLRLRYERHEQAENALTVWLRDERYPVAVALRYQGYGELPLLSRWYEVANLGDEPIQLEAARSAVWYVPSGYDYRLTHLAGNWGAEYGRNQTMLTQARTVLQNTRVTCAAAQQTPFFALDRDGRATETEGDVFFGALHWSGDFAITVEQQYRKQTSVTGGVNDSGYRLAPGERFETPRFTGGFVTGGFERMSETLYDWQFDFLAPRGDRTDKAHAVRPIIYNSWYPYEFDVNEENCLALIDKCADIGAELFVIDDGWMPRRTSDRAGLGDWRVDEKRFPRGMKPIADACHQRGLLFGLWVEPEMVNPDSDLYRAHPDWVIGDPTRERTLQRNQLVLNLARDDVRDWAIGWLDALIRDCELDYLKWDMNRYVTEDGWPDAPEGDAESLPIRYTRNLMRIWEHLNRAHPDLLLENCASGGGRSDFGMVPMADRINRSDNADPVDIMLIHEGFSMLFVPKTAGGAGNIAPAVHHIHGRATPLDFRVRWGMTGSMSIGVNLLTAAESELATLRLATAEFKRLRPDLQDAYVYRIASATEHPWAAFGYVRRDREAFTLFVFAHGVRAWDLYPPRFQLRGLKPEAVYEDDTGLRMTGDALMNIGLRVVLKGDYQSRMWTWRRVE